jgi:hypothetical protein
VSLCSPRSFRWYQHPDFQCFCHPSLGPPNALATSLLLRPRLWKLFWSLNLNTKAITPWWRLLHDSIGITSKLPRWNSVFFPRNICPICQSEIEDLPHFSVECLQKRDF